MKMVHTKITYDVYAEVDDSFEESDEAMLQLGRDFIEVYGDEYPSDCEWEVIYRNYTPRSPYEVKGIEQ